MTFSDQPELYTFEALNDRAVTLTPEQIDQARLDSQTAPDRWQDYCDRLAHFGLVNWLAENNLLAVQAASAQDLQVRDFVVRSHFISASEEEFVTLSQPASQTVLSNPAHFHVLATVAEEQGQVWISGFLSHEQMQMQLAAINFSKDPIELPIEVFNPKLETLCLALRATEAVPFETKSKVSKSLADRVVNLRTWLSRQLDDTLDSLDGWEPLGLQASALRSGSIGALPQILQSLARKGIRLADSTQGLSRILPIGPIPLRLYVMPGDITPEQEWEMLVVLESATAEPMPSGLMLRIRDDEKVMLEQTFDPQTTSDRSLFAEVVSGLDESVFVDIVLPNGKVHSLPKFVFQDI